METTQHTPDKNLSNSPTSLSVLEVLGFKEMTPDNVTEIKSAVDRYVKENDVPGKVLTREEHILLRSVVTLQQGIRGVVGILGRNYSQGDQRLIEKYTEAYLKNISSNKVTSDEKYTVSV